MSAYEQAMGTPASAGLRHGPIPFLWFLSWLLVVSSCTSVQVKSPQGFHIGLRASSLPRCCPMCGFLLSWTLFFKAQPLCLFWVLRLFVWQKAATPLPLPSLTENSPWGIKCGVCCHHVSCPFLMDPSSASIHSKQCSDMLFVCLKLCLVRGSTALGNWLAIISIGPLSSFVTWEWWYLPLRVDGKLNK